MLFFTDLDKTLIYSGYADHFCVEHKDDVKVTYMTQRAYDCLTDLLAYPDFHLIPCTLRSWEQTRRITFINNEQTPIVICDNGLSIYHNGILDIFWDERMQLMLKNFPNRETVERIKEYIEENGIRISQIKSNRDAFFTVIFLTKDDAERYVSELQNLINSDQYTMSLQGRKFYIIPRFLDKSLAVKYVKELMPKEFVVTAGDSDVDALFIVEGDMQLLPAHSPLQIPTAKKTSVSNIYASEAMLTEIKQIVNI